MAARATVGPCECYFKSLQMRRSIKNFDSTTTREWLTRIADLAGYYSHSSEGEFRSGARAKTIAQPVGEPTRVANDPVPGSCDNPMIMGCAMAAPRSTTLSAEA